MNKGASNKFKYTADDKEFTRQMQQKNAIRIMRWKEVRHKQSNRLIICFVLKRYCKLEVIQNEKLDYVRCIQSGWHELESNRRSFTCQTNAQLFYMTVPSRNIYSYSKVFFG